MKMLLLVAQTWVLFSRFAVVVKQLLCGIMYHVYDVVFFDVDVEHVIARARREFDNRFARGVLFKGCSLAT